MTMRFSCLLLLMTGFVLALPALGQEGPTWQDDPAIIDDTAPPAMREVAFTSAGARMNGLIYIANGAGPHPTVLLLHGYPGNEKNLDLAQNLRRAGWNVVFFHYRGAWGSEGEFSVLNSQADVAAVLDQLQQPDRAAALRIDPDRLVLVGHSMGGHLAMAGLVDNPEVACTVNMDGVNWGYFDGLLKADPAARDQFVGYSDGLGMLAGWSGKKLITEIQTSAEALDFTRRFDQRRPILLVAGGGPDAIPLENHFNPMIAALEASGHSHHRLVVMNDDHSFSASRVRLAETIIDFLNTSCR